MDKFESILLGDNGLGMKHVLHLYSSGMNKYSVQIPFISPASKREEVIYVTAHEDLLKEELEVENLGADLIIYRPEEMGNINTHNKGRIVIDVSSFNGDSVPAIEERKEERRVIGKRTLYEKYSDYIQREEYLNNLCEKNPCAYNILCSYNMDELNSEMCMELMNYHDRVILVTDDRDVSTPPSALLESTNGIAEEHIVEFVKNYLNLIVLALISKQKMCGTDMIKCIQNSFNVSLSTGTLYPLLHELEKKGLVECEYGIKRRYKKRIYKPKDEERIKDILTEHLQSNNILNRFLQSFPLVSAPMEKR